MLFQSDDGSLRLEITGYELPEDAGGDEEDRNWLLVRATWTGEGGLVVKDTNGCLLAGELEAMTAGLKVLRAGIRDRYDSDFTLPYFALTVTAEGKGYPFYVSFALPNSMDADEAEVRGVLSGGELKALIDELDRLCARYPERK